VQVTVAPNPSTTHTTLEWQQSVPAVVSVELYGTGGRFVQSVFTDRVLPGKVRIPVENVQSGSYLCAVIVNGARTVVPLTVVR